VSSRFFFSHYEELSTRWKLVTDDEARTPIARTHRRCYGILGKRRKATLEVYPAGLHMLDLIIVTFVYVEHVRRDRERASKHGWGPS
jgi:hypothetical protein